MAPQSPMPSMKPALSPPEGVTPNFVDPETMWEENMATQVVCLTLAGITFILRCYGRLFLSEKRWSLEDWFICLAFAGLAAQSTVQFHIADAKGGAHQWNLTISELQRILYLFWVGSIVYGPAILFTKVAILLMYLRIFLPNRRTIMWWMIWGVLVLTTMFYTSTTIAKIWQCNPREKIWNKTLPGTCISVPTVLSASGYANTISDVLILLIPVKGVWKLKMSVPRKIGACLILTFGALAPVASALGMWVRIRTASSKDASYNLPPIAFWGTAETAVGVMCACLPAIPAIYRTKIRSRQTTYTANSGQAYYGASGGQHHSASSGTKYSREDDYELEKSKSAGDKSINKSSSVLHLENERGAQLVSEARGGATGNSEEQLIIERPMRGESSGEGIVRTVEFNQRDSVHRDNVARAI